MCILLLTPSCLSRRLNSLLPWRIAAIPGAVLDVVVKEEGAETTTTTEAERERFRDLHKDRLPQMVAIGLPRNNSNDRSRPSSRTRTLNLSNSSSRHSSHSGLCNLPPSLSHLLPPPRRRRCQRWEDRRIRVGALSMDCRRWRWPPLVILISHRISWPL